jgi:hypothetical protein
MLGRKTKMLAGARSLGALAAAACSSPSGGGDGGSSSGGTQAAAKSLGIDLNKCAVDPTNKLTGTINIGQTLVLSGGLAAAYAPDKAIAAAQKLIQQNNVAAMTSVIGDPRSSPCARC